MNTHDINAALDARIAQIDEITAISPHLAPIAGVSFHWPAQAGALRACLDCALRIMTPEQRDEWQRIQVRVYTYQLEQLA